MSRKSGLPASTSAGVLNTGDSITGPTEPSSVESHGSIRALRENLFVPLKERHQGVLPRALYPKRTEVHRGVAHAELPTNGRADSSQSRVFVDEALDMSPC